VQDIEGNIYKTIKIGDQIWMAENLRTITYNDGTPIPNPDDNDVWLRTDAWCNYYYDSSNVAIYGRLYNQNAILSTHKICPSGWHPSTYEEWIILETYLGGSVVAGGKLKETDTTHWKSPNIGATNSSGFTALPGGTRIGLFDVPGSAEDIFGGLGHGGFYWSSHPIFLYDPEIFVGRLLLNSSSEIISFFMSDFPDQIAFSVRCIKD
jgi:uncharacterized protein (TIGR02145 family)